jgi:hypothetical protein
MIRTNEIFVTNGFSRKKDIVDVNTAIIAFFMIILV